MVDKFHIVQVIRNNLRHTDFGENDTEIKQWIERAIVDAIEAYDNQKQ